MLHFAFFLKNFKNEENKIILQEIYDFNFRQLELSIREIGYGDQSINKKMKDYINLFHSMVSEIHFWNEFNKNTKIRKVFYFFRLILTEIEHLLDYFELFNDNLSKKTLNSYLKSVSNLIIMAVPKRKQTPSRTGMRRAQTMKYSTKNIVEDKKSGEYRLSHHLDLKTGMYKGRQVLDPKE